MTHSDRKILRERIYWMAERVPYPESPRVCESFLERRLHVKVTEGRPDIIQVGRVCHRKGEEVIEPLCELVQIGAWDEAIRDAKVYYSW